MDRKRPHESQSEEGRPAISCPPSVNQPYPWLVILDGADYSRQTFYSITHNRFYIRNIPEMENKFIISSQQGWLFLEDNVTDDCLLFNLSTLEKWELPPLGFPDADHRSVLSSCTKIDNGCRILVIWGGLFTFRSYYLGDKDFIEKPLRYDSTVIHDSDPINCLNNVASVLNYDGKLYALEFHSWNLSVADFDDPDLLFTPIIEEARSLNPLVAENGKYYLIESSGEILFVYTKCFDHDGMDIKIYRADLNRKQWVKVKCSDLDDRALFLDDYKGLSYTTTPGFGFRSNCVYYVNSCGDRNLYVYDMKDRRITMSLPCPCVSNKLSTLYWAM